MICLPTTVYWVLVILPLLIKRYKIEPSIGLLLPCNVVVRMDNNKNVHVEFMDPSAIMDLVNKLELIKLSQVELKVKETSLPAQGDENTWLRKSTVPLI